MILVGKALEKRILSTMTKNPVEMLAATAEELNELGKEVCKIIRTGNINHVRVLEELADVIVMLVALIDYEQYYDNEITAAIKRVCERYEQGNKPARTPQGDLIN